ncbi:unnamed protein product [Bursaphelenchus okinawaensis]|uniref:WD_REPEATS_REGION domain-containing protein n=1 Tax=Bursaphelenchus okinawaensis TaxID=465554 RepID=A0A811LPP0_9BILA|nr:unnamed protein product [Bursaphelenchus okinawaensis]CAG9126560.1 unnamed protein product [Bursaphelenchus okinawaensis]
MMQVAKRPAEDDNVYGKRQRLDVVLQNDGSSKPRTSSLMAPIMLLTGHQGEIFASRFSPNGKYLASSGFDQKILLWNVHGDCENFATLKGHTGAVLDLHFSTDSNFVFSCGTDKTVRIFDMEDGRCVRRFKGHSEIVNSCHPARRGPTIVASASDDGTVLINDERSKLPTLKIKALNNYQVTSVTFNDNAQEIICGGIDNTIKHWDIRRGLLNTFEGHEDTITGLSLSPDGKYVLSNSMDCTARIWDIQPFTTGERCVRLLQGHQHNFEKNLLKAAWSPDSKRVSVGSSDRFTYVYDVAKSTIEYKLPGHQGSVNAVDFHPEELILLSAGSDKKIYMGELEPSNSPKTL